MRRLEVAVASMVLAVLSLGLATLPLQSRHYTQALSWRVSEAAQAGLSQRQAVSIAEDVRLFVVADRGKLPVSETGTAFSAEAVSHLRDVQLVLRGARSVTAGLLVVVAAWSVLALRRPDGRRLVSRTFRSAAIGLVVALALVVGVALLDFESFFSAFHSVFFAQGSWTFPSDSLLIRLFPERYWIVSGVSWALLVALLAGVYGLLGSSLALKERTGR